MHKILLIGSTGKIGRHVLNELFKNKHFDIRVLVRQHNDDRFSSYIGDILERDSLRSGISWSDIVVNCAGIVSYKKKDQDILHKINVDGTRNIVDICSSFNKLLVHTSSAVVYGSTKEQINHKENLSHTNAYLSGYAISKLLADKIILDSPVKSLILRPSTLISSHGSTFSKLLKLYRNGFVADLKGGASFANPSDIAKAYSIAILNLLKQECQHEVYNLGGNNILISEVFEFFKKQEPRKTFYITNSVLNTLSFINDRFLLPVFNKSIITRENFLTGNRFTYLDSTKAENNLGYTVTSFFEAADNILNHVNHR